MAFDWSCLVFVRLVCQMGSWHYYCVCSDCWHSRFALGKSWQGTVNAAHTHTHKKGSTQKEAWPEGLLKRVPSACKLWSEAYFDRNVWVEFRIVRLSGPSMKFVLKCCFWVSLKCVCDPGFLSWPPETFCGHHRPKYTLCIRGKATFVYINHKLSLQMPTIIFFGLELIKATVCLYLTFENIMQLNKIDIHIAGAYSGAYQSWIWVRGQSQSTYTHTKPICWEIWVKIIHTDTSAIKLHLSWPRRRSQAQFQATS